MKYRDLFILFILFSVSIGSIAQDKQETASLITIETSSLSFILKKDDSGKLKHLYFGDKIEDKTSFLGKRFLHRPDTKEDFIPSGYIEYGGRNYLEPALKVTHADGSQTTELKVTGYNKQIESDKVLHTISMKDIYYNFHVDLVFEAYQKENIITQHVVIRNEEDKNVVLENFYSCYLPVNSQSYYLTDFHGTWAKEMQQYESLLTPGAKAIESRKGNRTAQSENSSFILSLNQKAKAYEGEVIMGTLAWTGNYKINFELDETNQLNILGGINPFGSAYSLSVGQEFVTPKMIFTYSSQGYNLSSRNFHDWGRKYVLNNGDKIGEIVLNSWEGAYFKFNEAKILKMIDNAAYLGVEVFVLDDGWFGNKFPRDSDKVGLGDWQLNTKKLPKGIDYLAKHSKSKGLRFGIWIEPEMVNPESELGKKHPDWVVKSPHRDMPTLRNQWLLDLSNPDVQNFVFKVFDDVVGLSKDITYIKWDANRHAESIGSEYLGKDEQSKFWIDYINGLYKVYDRIRAKYPDITIQLCSSGGGRLDFGALKYHDEFWPSDNTDPYTRIPLQFSTGLFFPAKSMATHVTVSPNHQTGNESSLKLRCDVAMMGRMGVELQPDNMNPEEISFLKNAINSYKEVRDIVQFGDMYQLRSPYEEGEWSATSYVSKDKNRGLFFAFSLDFHERTIMTTFKLKGLDSAAKYKIKELNATKKQSFWGNDQTFTGEYLMKVGINPNIRNRGESIVLYLEKL